MKKLFGWARFHISPEEVEDSSAAKARAGEIARAADRFKNEAPAVGERQRQLRRENHFGLKLESVYKKA